MPSGGLACVVDVWASAAVAVKLPSRAMVMTLIRSYAPGGGFAERRSGVLAQDRCPVRNQDA